MKIFETHEKRLSLRRRWRSKVVFEDEFGQGLIYLYSRDISMGGLFLENPPPIKLGAQLFLSFILPGKKRPLKVTGQVVRFLEHNGDAGEVLKGAGIRFIDLDPKNFKMLADFVQKGS